MTVLYKHLIEEMATMQFKIFEYEYINASNTNSIRETPKQKDFELTFLRNRLQFVTKCINKSIQAFAKMETSRKFNLLPRPNFCPTTKLSSFANQWYPLYQKGLDRLQWRPDLHSFEDKFEAK